LGKSLKQLKEGDPPAWGLGERLRVTRVNNKHIMKNHKKFSRSDDLKKLRFGWLYNGRIDIKK